MLHFKIRNQFIILLSTATKTKFEHSMSNTRKRNWKQARRYHNHFPISIGNLFSFRGKKYCPPAIRKTEDVGDQTHQAKGILGSLFHMLT